MHEVKMEFKGLSLPDTARALFMCARENAYIIVTAVGRRSFEGY